MKAVVPAAGEGTRLGALTDGRPKALVEVGGEPLLAHVLSALRQLSPEEVVVVVGREGGPIRERFGSRWRGIPLRWAVQPRPTGLADALLAAEGRVDGDFVTLYGDNVCRADLRAPVARFREEGLDALLLTLRVPPSEARQGLCLTDGDGRLTRIVEHPDERQRREGLVVTGFNAFSPAIFDACRRVEPSEEGERELPDAVNLLLREGRPVETMPLDGWRVNVNTPEDLARAERRLAGTGQG